MQPSTGCFHVQSTKSVGGLVSATADNGSSPEYCIHYLGFASGIWMIFGNWYQPGSSKNAGILWLLFVLCITMLACINLLARGCWRKRVYWKVYWKCAKEIVRLSCSAGSPASVMTLLLEKGLDVNAQGGSYGNALQAASYGGHDSIVTLLVDKGADANAQGDTMAMHFRQLPTEVMTLL
jgi:hypothetical protein